MTGEEIKLLLNPVTENKIRVIVYIGHKKMDDKILTVNKNGKSCLNPDLPKDEASIIRE